MFVITPPLPLPLENAAVALIRQLEAHEAEALGAALAIAYDAGGGDVAELVELGLEEPTVLVGCITC